MTVTDDILPPQLSSIFHLIYLTFFFSLSQCYSSGRGEGEKGVTGPRSAVMSGTCCPAGVLPTAPRLSASHIPVQVGAL